MRLSFTVILLLVAYAASYPSDRQAADDDDLELELRSILNHLSDEQDSNEQMTRALDSSDDDEDDEDNSNQMSKRQGGHNIIDQQSKCEIGCIQTERYPAKGPGKTIKEAAKVCKNVCKASSKKRGGKKPNNNAKYPKREMMEERAEDDDSDSNSDENQQRREFFDYLQAQLQDESDK